MTCQGVCRKIEFDYRKYVCYMSSLPLEENLPEMQILSTFWKVCRKIMKCT